MAAHRGIRLPLYMIPIVLGLCGILFAGQLKDSLIPRMIVLLFSVGGPMFVIGMLLARLQASTFQRTAMIIGVFLLALGAFATLSGFEDSVTTMGDASRDAVSASRWIGLASLIVGLFAIVFILARREEQIEEVADRFRYLADHMSEGFILSSADGSITLVNDALLQMTGLTSEQLIGKNGRDLAAQFDLEPMMPHLDHRSLGVASEYRLAWRRHGVERQLWVSGTPLFDSRGRFNGALATIRDVTEQHQMSKRLERYAQGLQELVEDRTEKLYQSRQRLRDLLMHMNEAFVTVDNGYHIRFANARFCDLIGVNSDHVVGQDLFDYVDPAARGRLLDLFASASPAQGARPQQELSLRRIGGADVSVVVSIAPIEPSPEEDARFSLVMTDVEELKRMQQQLEARAAELEEANAELRMLDRAKDSFLSTVTHELRTPLSTVRGYAEMLDTGSLGNLEPAQANALKVMLRNTERLGSLIDEVIEYSRMEVRGVQLHQTLFSAEKLLSECAASMEPQVRARDLHISINASPDTSLMWADRRRLVQTLTILLSNAVKFCRAGDIITLSAERRVGGTIAVAVSDTGIGIDANAQRRVFDKFYQADSSLSRRYEGAGIGLSIAKAIAEAHRGHIDLQSEPGKGSTFTIILPQASFLATEPEAVPAFSGGGSILLAVSETEFAVAIRDALIAKGFEITMVPSGLACIREVKQKQPGLLIIDDVLPDLGGTATIRRMHQEIGEDDFPVLLMAGEEHIRRQDEIGVQLQIPVLYKPFTVDELVEGAARAFGLEAPASKTVSATTRARRVASSSVLVISQDEDLIDWVSSAMRARKIRCVGATSIDDAIDTARAIGPRIVVIECESADEGSAALFEGAQELAHKHSAQLVVLTTGETAVDEAAEGVRVVRIPCSSRELAEALSISSPVMA